GRTVLDLIMSKDFFSKYINVFLVLVANGGRSNLVNKEGKNILQIIYEIFPDIKNDILSFGIPENNLNNTSYVFSHIPLMSLVKFHSTAHKARSHFLNLVILLACNTNEDSFFQKLPMELVEHILSFSGDFAAMDISYKEGIFLARAAFEQKDKIRSML